MNNGKDEKKDSSKTVSAKDLLAKLHANINQDAERGVIEDETPAPDKIDEETEKNSKISDDSFINPVFSENASDKALESDGLDVDELMKKYLPEEDYEKLSQRVVPDQEAFEEAELAKIDIGARIKDAENYVKSITDSQDIPDYKESQEDADYASDDEVRGEAGDNLVSEQLSEGVENASDDREEFIDAEDDTAEFDEMDVNLMIAFGMEDELQQVVGEQTMEQIEARIEKNNEQCDPDMLDDSSDDIPPEYEYTSNVQTKDIFRKFKNQYRGLITKLVISFVIMAIVFIYDNSSLLGINLPTKINAHVYPVIHIMIGLQLVMLSGLLVINELREGLVAFVKLKPIPESITFLMFVIGIIYSIVMCFAPAGQNILLFGLPVTMCVFFTLIYEFLNLKRSIFSFNIIASKKLKYAIAESDDEGIEQEVEAFRDYLPETPTIFRVNKTPFIDGFFRRSRVQSQNKVALNAVFPLALAIAVIAFAVSFIRVDNGYTAASYGFMTLMLAMPVSAFVTYSYPFYRASKVAYKKGSAIIGEGALDEYSSASVITFDDRDVFPSRGVRMKSVKVYDSHRIDHVIYNAASVFHEIGGPLSDVFDVVTRDIGYSDSVEILSMDDDGIEAMVGETNVHIGKESYILRCGFKADESENDILLEDPTVNVIYMVENGDVSAKLYMQYQIDPDFESNLKILYKAGICVGIKTCDPNIDDEMLGKYIPLDKYPVKVLKHGDSPDENYKRKKRVDSGIVSKSSPKVLLEALALCDKIQHATKIGVIIKLFATIIPIGIIAFLLFNQVFEFSSLYVSLYQLFWMIPIFIASRTSI